MGFLRQVLVNTAKRQREGNWRSAVAEIILKSAGAQTLGTYIDKKKAIVVEWVALRPKLEVFNRETGYEGGGRHHEPWWRQTAARDQLSATLEDLLSASSERRQESGM